MTGWPRQGLADRVDADTQGYGLTTAADYPWTVPVVWARRLGGKGAPYLEYFQFACHMPAMTCAVFR